MTKAERLLFMVKILRTMPGMSVHKLAAECRVSKRTIYRDLVSLAGLDIPVCFENGYRLVDHSVLPVFNFSQEEQELLGYCLESSPLQKSSELGNKLRRIELKIIHAIPDSKKESLNDLITYPRKEMKLISREEDLIIMRFIQALVGAKQISITLRSGDDFEGLWPVQLQVDEANWLLLMTDNRRTKTIAVPLNKIRNLEVVISGSFTSNGGIIVDFS